MPSLSTRPFFTDNPGGLPYSYPVPASVELIVQSIVARFNGAGAGGSFLPCLAIYTQDGHLIARVHPDRTYKVGDTGVVTYAPFLRRRRPDGAALQIYNGEFTAANFSTNSTVFVSTGYPNNPTFTKLSDTSYLDMRGTFDFTPGGAPDVIFCGLFRDGVNEEAVGIHIAAPASFASAVLTKVFSSTPATLMPAGAYALDVRIASLNAETITLRTSTSVDLEIVEYEPGF